MTEITLEQVDRARRAFAEAGPWGRDESDYTWDNGWSRKAMLAALEAARDE